MNQGHKSRFLRSACHILDDDKATAKIQQSYEFEEMQVLPFKESGMGLQKEYSINTNSSSISDSSFPQPPPSTPVEKVKENWETSATLRFAMYDSFDPFEHEIPETGTNEKVNQNKIKSQEIPCVLSKIEIKECNLFERIENFASIFVDDIINTSVDKIVEKRSELNRITNIEKETKESSSRTNYVTSMSWPRICDFSVNVGKSSINDFILTWRYDENWLYCINFLISKSDEYSDYHVYEVKWSIPTDSYPIPQAVASIYFTIEVSRCKPQYCLVDVTYVYEGSKFILSPGKLEFQESFLFDVIDAKLQLYKNLLF